MWKRRVARKKKEEEEEEEEEREKEETSKIQDPAGDSGRVMNPTNKVMFLTDQP